MATAKAASAAEKVLGRFFGHRKMSGWTQAMIDPIVE
jgi:hypothetical protein